MLNDLKQKTDFDIDNSVYLDGEPELTFGYLLGVMHRTKSKRSVSFQTELTYQQKGGKFPRVFGNLKFHYLDLSIIGLIDVLDKTTIDFGVSNSFTKKELIEKHDVGLIAGISQFFGENIQLSIRYYYGLKSINTMPLTGDSGDYIGELKFYNRNIQFTVGYHFL